MAHARRVFLPFALYTLFNFTVTLLEVPTVRLFEQATCARHFQRLEVPEAACKTPAIQNRLAAVMGWKLTLDACAGLLTAMYYGSVAERRGANLVLLLATLGYIAMLILDVVICSFPILLPVQTVWLSSVLLLAGGGQRVFNSMIFTLVSDEVDDESRTTYLYWLALGPHCTRFLSPRVAASLMKKNLLAPFWLGVAGLVLMLWLILSNVERKMPKDSRTNLTDDYTPIEGDSSPPRLTISESGSRDSDASTFLLPPQTTAFSPLTGLQDVRTLLWQPITRFCLAAVYLKKLGFASSVFAPQYVSEKLGWALHETTWLRVISGAGAIIVTALAPTLTATAIRHGVAAPQVIDLISIRAALAVLSVSFLVTGKAEGDLLMMLSMLGIGLGEALEPALQGTITFAADQMDRSQIFTIYAFFDAAAELMAGPITAKLMAIGRTENHSSEGICFLASSMIFGALLSWACAIKINGHANAPICVPAAVR